jgi:hypothetical protein
MSLDELARAGARRIVTAALEAEVDACIAAHAALTDEHGHRQVRRNGYGPVRMIATGVVLDLPQGQDTSDERGMSPWQHRSITIKGSNQVPGADASSPRVQA